MRTAAPFDTAVVISGGGVKDEASEISNSKIRSLLEKDKWKLLLISIVIKIKNNYVLEKLLLIKNFSSFTHFTSSMKENAENESFT